MAGKSTTQLIEASGPRGQFIFHGSLLGEATSYREEHFDHQSEYAAKGERCFACRWFHAQIFEITRVNDEGSKMRYPNDHGKRYLVVTTGGSIVRGEHQLKRLAFTDSPHDIIEILTIRKAGVDPYLPAVSARSLAQAAQYNSDIRDAFENRAVL